MKRFRFSLETVKTYKDRLLEQLKAEYALRLSEVSAKEEEIRLLEIRKQQVQEEFNHKNADGLSVLENIQYERYLDALQNQIRIEKKRREDLVLLAEEKKEEVIEMNKETTSLSKLKEKKLIEHSQLDAKEQERFLEEFISQTTYR